MNLQTLPIEAKREALALLEAKAHLKRQREAEEERRRVRENAEAIRARCVTLAGFVREAWPVLEPETDYVHGWHIDAVCSHLEAVTRGEINRLLINIPPGTMKSLLVSVLWPAWEWAQGRRALRYLTTSFAEDNAKRDTRKMRDLVMSDWYQALWPEVKLTRTGEMSFANTATGWRECSAFGSLTSKRGDRLIIDDPHSVDTAESDTERATTTRRFREGATNRLNDMKRSAIVVIMQRLHEDDVSGTILSLGMDYVHLCLPMEYDPQRSCRTPIGFEDPRRHEGDLLDPIRFPRDVVEKLKRDMGPYAYAGQYDQRPGPRDGAFFHKAWFDGGLVQTPMGSRQYERRRYVPGRQPEHLRIYLTSDHAPTAGPKSDSNGVRVWGVDAVGDLWLLGGRKGRMRMDELAEIIIGNHADRSREAEGRPKIDGLIREWSPRAWFPENDNNYKAVEPFVLRRMREEEVRVRIEPISPHGQDKATRAQAAQSMAAMGRIHIPEGAEGDQVVQELISFPAGAHDEEVDLLAIMCRALDMAHPALVEPEKPNEAAPPKGINQMTWDELMAQQKPAVDRV